MRKRNLKQSKWMALAVCSTAVMLAVNGCQAHKTSMDGSSQTTVQDSQSSDQGNQTDGDSKNQNSPGTGEQNGADVCHQIHLIHATVKELFLVFPFAPILRNGSQAEGI